MFSWNGNMVMIIILSFMLCLNSIAVNCIKTRTSSFTQDYNCNQFLNPVRISLLQTITRSNIECCSTCLQHDNCKYVKSSRDNENELWCELFTFNVSPCTTAVIQNLTALHSDGEMCYTMVDEIPSADAMNGTSELTEDLFRSEWISFIDTKDTTTLSSSHLATRVNWIEKTKTVIRLTSGQFQIFSNNFWNTNLLKLKVGMIYAMEETNQRFVPDGKRIIHTCNGDAQCQRSSFSVNGISKTNVLDTSRMMIFTQNNSEYSLRLETVDPNVTTLIKWLRQGYPLLHYRYALIWPDESAVSLYNINEDMAVLYGTPRKPFTVASVVRVYPLYYKRMKIKMGSPRQRELSSLADDLNVALSPHWKPAYQSPIGINQKIAILRRYMRRGHKFRVGFAGGFFDVHDALDTGNDMYFLLPQQVNGTDMSTKSIGIRAFVSLSGIHSWCSHQLQGEDVLGTGVERDVQIQLFVDKREWTVALSVFSNGTIAFGESSDLAEAVLIGKDVNVLIDSPLTGIARGHNLPFLTVSDHGQPDVLVSGQSKESWNIECSEQTGGLVINSGCNMVHILVTSNGSVEELVHNVVFRQSPVILDNVLVTWFVY